MRIKTDENIGRDAVQLLKHHGHDVMTAREQSLGGRSDDAIFEVCCAERRRRYEAFVAFGATSN